MCFLYKMKFVEVSAARLKFHSEKKETCSHTSVNTHSEVDCFEAGD